MVSQQISKWLQRSLTICLVLFLGAVGLVFILGLTLPDHFEVQRTVTLNATRGEVHPLLGDLKRWEEWTAIKWNGDDLIHEYSDPSTGEGAWHAWRGDESKAGRIEITLADFEKGVWYDLTFDTDPDPINGALRYLESESGVVLEWSLRGALDGPMERALGPVISWRMGADLDAGLSSLTDAVEGTD